MNLSFALLAMVLFAGCYGTSEEDLSLTIHKDVPGAVIKTGDLVELSAIERTVEGEVLWRSDDYDRTALVEAASPIFKNDLFAALGKLSKGDSATVLINLDSMVLRMGHGRPATKKNYVVYELKIHDVVANKEAFMQKRSAQLKEQEAGKLANYILAKGLKTERRASGLQYTVTTAGAQPPASLGDTVELLYAVRLMSGKVIDAAVDTPRKYICGLHQAVPGLEEAMQVLPGQTKATVILPSALAFGEQGYEGIQPFTPLIYDLEIARIGRFMGKRPTEAGAPLPDFAVTNIANNILVQKEDVAKGKVVLVLFTTDCEHCQHLTIALEKKQRLLKDVHWYLISQDSPDAIRQALQQYGPSLLTAPNVTICHDDQRRMAGIFHTTAYPSVYVYDKQHKLVKHMSGALEQIVF